MLRYLVDIARSANPTGARRDALTRLIGLLVVLEIGQFVLNVTTRPHAGLVFDFIPSLVLVVVYVMLVITVVPSLVLYSTQRWRRERYLANLLGREHDIRSVYLSPALVSFVEDQAGTPLNAYMESASLVITETDIEIWAGGREPSRKAVIALASVVSVRFIPDQQRFRRPELRVNFQTIPLYAAIGMLGLSRRSSRTLYETLFDARDSARTL